MSLEDQPWSGRPSTSRTDENIQKIRDAIMFDCRRTIDALEALTGVLWSSCQWILTEELHMERVAAKFVPCLLSEDQRANRLDVCREMKDKWKFIQTVCPKSPNFFLFPRMKRDLKGKRFQNVEEVREKMMEALKAITLQEFHNCFEQWKKLWDKCIDSQGEYFEGD